MSRFGLNSVPRQGFTLPCCTGMVKRAFVSTIVVRPRWITRFRIGTSRNDRHNVVVRSKAVASRSDCHKRSRTLVQPWLDLELSSVFCSSSSQILVFFFMSSRRSHTFLPSRCSSRSFSKRGRTEDGTGPGLGWFHPFRDFVRRRDRRGCTARDLALQVRADKKKRSQPPTASPLRPGVEETWRRGVWPLVTLLPCIGTRNRLASFHKRRTVLQLRQRSVLSWMAYTHKRKATLSRRLPLSLVSLSSSI